MISGYRIPGIVSESTDSDRLKHVIGSLVLFKSFRNLAELTGEPNPTATTWTNIYSEWEGKRGKFVIEIMGNMHDFTFGRSKAAEAAVNHQFGWAAEYAEDAQSTGSNSDDSDDEMFLDEDDSDSANPEKDQLSDIWRLDEDILDSNKLNPAICPSCLISSDHTRNITTAFTDCGILDVVASRTATLVTALDYDVDFPVLSVMKKWVRDSSTDNPMTTSAPAAPEPARDTEVIEMLDEALDVRAMQWGGSLGVSPDSLKWEFLTISDVSAQFTLNRLQHAAFRTIGSALLKCWQKSDDLNYRNEYLQESLRKDQLLFYLGGEGGTGKTRVIGAVQEFCSSWRRGDCLLKTALTGTAATLISGRTLASFLLVLKGSSSCATLGIDVLVIDEVSMMHKSELVELDQRLRNSTRNASVPFGGIIVILVGNFLQLPPVGADPLYIAPWKKAKCSASAMTGYELWQTFKSCVILEESVRFKSDPEWAEGCRLARLGVWTPAFVSLINSRVLQREEEGEEESGCNLSMNGVVSTFVTPDNATRQTINNVYMATTAKQLPGGQHPVGVVANFKQKLRGLSRFDVEMVMRLPDNKFGRMAPFLDLVPGMPVQITQNVRAAKMVANGTLGTLEKIIFQPGTSFRLARDCCTGVVVKIPSLPPQAVIVRIPRRPVAKYFDSNIDSDLFPILFYCEPFKHYDISLPCSPNGESRRISVKIAQFPLVCAVGSTIYKVQGETLNAMVVTEWRPQMAIANNKEQPYLLVSRVTSRHAFATLEPITPEIVAWAHPSTEALNEERRLKILSDNTVAGMED